MQTIIETEVTSYQEKTVAIVQFGPPSITSGTRAGEYYQVTIDPSKISPDGLFIRFGNNQGDEIVGWQRCAVITVVSILGNWEGDELPLLHYGEDLPALPTLLSEMHGTLASGS